MAEISIQVDCGNSPKREFLKEYHIALANGDIDFVAQNLAEEVKWEVNGGPVITTKAAFLKALQGFSMWKVKKLALDAVITHGNEAAVSGQFVTKDNLDFVFCEVYKFKGFKGTTIKSIKTFLIRPEMVE